MDRRRFLAVAGGGLGCVAWGRPLLAADAGREARLEAGKIRRRYLVPPERDSEFWAYNGSLPGPELRFRKGDRVRIVVANHLDHNTTVHWHGLRIPNAMDGVPLVTQPPIRPGEEFAYEFALKDSGTYWYHPHERSFEQVGRGLCGPLIVEEERPPAVDRELTWMLSDFKLRPEDGAHAEFGQMAMHAKEGRLGNVVTLNGQQVGAGTKHSVTRGERVRLRLVNAATARVFELAFAGQPAWVIAYDGQGVEPHRLSAPLLLGPGMRADLILDFVAEGKAGHDVVDAVSGLVIAGFFYRDAPAVRAGELGAPSRLAGNELPKVSMKTAQHHYIAFTGGDAGPPVIGVVDDREVGYAEMKSRYGLAWTVAGHAVDEGGHHHEPLLVLKRNSHVVLTLDNKTAFEHPIHLHGHTFRVLTYNGTPPAHEEWRDTVFMRPWDEVQIAFVADNPGDWMFHCHILEHAASGMMGVIRVE